MIYRQQFPDCLTTPKVKSPGVLNFSKKLILSSLFISVFSTHVVQLSGAENHADWILRFFTEDERIAAIPEIEDGYGVSFRDLNGDNRPDIYLVCFRSLNRLLINRGRGAFEDATIISGLGGNLMPLKNQNLELGSAAFDYDNDGDVDIMIAGWDITTRLYRNETDLGFREQRINAFPEADLDINGVALADVNGDGWLDMYLTDEHYTDRLFLQTGYANFIDFTFGGNLQSTGISQGAAFCDVDRDGDPDLYVTHWNAQDIFYENEGDGRFRKKDLPISVILEPFSTNNPAFSDFDNDGDFDLLVTHRDGACFLFLNKTAPGDSNWVFEDISDRAGLDDATAAYSGLFGDFNNDSWPDLFFTRIGSNQLYLNREGTYFEKVFDEELKGKRTYRTGAAYADYDSDGDLDLFVASKDTFAQFYVNPLNNEQYINLHIEGVRSNRDAIGTRVLIYPAGAERIRKNLLGSREVGGGNGYLSMNDLNLHFGLGQVAMVDVEVEYPSGRLVVESGLIRGNSYTIYEYPRIQRVMIRSLDFMSRLIQSPRFISEVGLFCLYLLILFVFLRIGVVRYSWKTSTLLLYWACYVLLLVLGLFLLDPLGRTRAWIAVQILMLISILIVGLFSERIHRYRKVRKRYRDILIQLSDKIVTIHDDFELLKTVVESIESTTEFEFCTAWKLSPECDKIDMGISQGLKIEAGDLNQNIYLKKLLEILPEKGMVSQSQEQELLPLFKLCRAKLFLPISRDKRLYGFLSLGSTGPFSPFSEEDRVLFATLANQMAVALDNNAFVRRSTELVEQLTESKVREQYLEEVENANASLDAKNQELQLLYNELKQTEMQLIHSEKMASLGQLVAGISHELNNPVGFIYANVKQLQKYIKRIEGTLEKGDIEAQLESLLPDLEGLISDTVRGSQTVKSLVESLKQFSHLDQAESKQTDIHEGIRSSLLILRPQLKDRVEVNTDFLSDGQIVCHPGQINQVLVNLISNAAQAVEENGIVKIHTEDENGNLKIEITDNGVGMSETLQKKIFDPFFTTKAIGEGTGLGLSISYSIIESHGGSISVKSAEGSGTTFTVILPKSGDKQADNKVQ